MSEPYGIAAASGAQQAGININTLADFAQVESNFRNVPTANGSTSATGVWQIEQGTWNDYVTKYDLPYGPSDINNPADQAAVASYIIKDYANTVSQATGQPATTLQTYGAYVFGPTAGGEIAEADPSTPLSQFVSPQALLNNSMQGWTVGQFYSVIGHEIGATAGEKVAA